jgi:hypothetical protein
MAEQWPLTLQQKLNQASFSEQLGDTTLRSETEIGLAKVRRRFTKGVDKLTVTIDVEKDEVATFKTFYDTTLNGGVTPFEFNDPYTNTLTEFRFDTSSPPRLSLIGANTLRLSMQWERIPV